jgi:hypothetical protein
MEIAQGMGPECKTLSRLQWDQTLNIQQTRAPHQKGCSSTSASFVRSLGLCQHDPAFSITDSRTIIIVSTVECVVGFGCQEKSNTNFFNCLFLSNQKSVGVVVEITSLLTSA